MIGEGHARGERTALTRRTVDMMRSRKFWILLCVIGILCLGAKGFSAALQSAPTLAEPVFVLLYHPWEENFGSTFRDHLTWLQQNGYQTIPPEKLMSYLEGEEVSLPAKPILLTFDDGTIENYEVVYPMLEEFGYTGISFVITGPEFTSHSNKFWWRKVDRSGILKIESHSRSHGLIWTSPRIIDFFLEEEDDYFLIKGLDSRLGAPIYEYDDELVNDRYFPDRRIADLCVRYVAQNGGKEFFKKEGWDEELLQVVGDFRNSHQDRGSYEKEARKNVRLRIELYRSKRIIEETIGHGKEVEFFAYPWGAYNAELILEVKKYGYRGAFTTDEGGNFPGDDPFKIKRFVITSDMTVEDLSDLLNSQ
jgi:peptidoglycan/xylan/chitin deacetylase (PgdA/CDA1 family)